MGGGTREARAEGEAAVGSKAGLGRGFRKCSAACRHDEQTSAQASGNENVTHALELSLQFGRMIGGGKVARLRQGLPKLRRPALAWPLEALAEPAYCAWRSACGIIRHPPQRGKKPMIDVHYWTTPNGHKLTIFLEETATPYKIIPVNIGKGEQFQGPFLAISPNTRIPAIVDHAPADGGKPIAVFESGAILLYLAEKTGRVLSRDTRVSICAVTWLV